MISIWEAETFYRKRDIVIIGAGFTGLWSAISIKEKFPQKSVLVIEKYTVPKGASTRNAGFACFGSFTEVLSDSRKMGWEKTKNLLQLRWDGLQKIRSYFPENQIDYEQCGGYEILKSSASLQHLQEVNQQIQTITNTSETYILNHKKRQQFGFADNLILIENPLEGSLHSGKLILKLLEKCHRLDVEFLFGTSVKKVEETTENIKLFISENRELEADKIIYCTNAFSNQFLEKEDIQPARGQILLTEPIENLPLKGTFHYDEGFYYFRNLGQRILLGGARNLDFENEATTHFETTDLLQNALENFLHDIILPNRKVKIQSRWSGIMAMGKEKSPIVKKISPRQYCAVRLSGMGVALAPKIGEIVAEMQSH